MYFPPYIRLSNKYGVYNIYYWYTDKIMYCKLKNWSFKAVLMLRFHLNDDLMSLYTRKNRP